MKTKAVGIIHLLTMLIPVTLIGCASSPETQFISLEAVPPQNHITPYTGPPVRVGEVRVPPELERQSLVLHRTGNRLDINETVRWPAALPVRIPQTLASDLAARLPRDKVIFAGQPTPTGPLRLVVVTFESFAVDPTNEVTLKAQWSLVDADSQRLLLSHTSQIETRPASSRGPDIAVAMSDALGKLADEITAALTQLKNRSESSPTSQPDRQSDTSP